MGLIGPNGAGKTTIIKLIMNIIRRDNGEIKIFGRDNLKEEARVKSRIGFVCDEPHFYEDVLLKDIKSAYACFFDKWDEALFLSLIKDFELPLKKKFKTLSQGMRIKFTLALALSHHPKLLVMDEPTSGLDPVFRRELLDKFYEFLQNEEKSILFSTHITSDLERIADYITLVRDGEICFSDPKDTVRDRWALVKGGKDLLSGDALGLLRAVQPHAFGFTALTDRAQEVKELFGSDVVIEKPSLGDLVYYFDRREGDA